MNKIRRHLLIFGAMTAASATLPLEAFGALSSTSAAAPPPPTESEYDALTALSADDFKPFVGAIFHTKSPNSLAVRIKLVEVQNPPTLAGAIPPPPSPQVYALRFKAVSGPILRQNTYVLQNTGLPPFAMFVVPSSANAKAVYYTGQVNRPAA